MRIRSWAWWVVVGGVFGALAVAATIFIASPAVASGAAPNTVCPTHLFIQKTL